MPKFQVNQRVKTIGNNYRGVITQVHHSCPQTNEWLSMQALPIRAEAVRSTWYSILVDGKQGKGKGGAVCVPEYDVLAEDDEGGDEKGVEEGDEGDEDDYEMNKPVVLPKRNPKTLDTTD
jgi:hypothetical protein